MLIFSREQLYATSLALHYEYCGSLSRTYDVPCSLQLPDAAIKRVRRLPRKMSHSSRVRSHREQHSHVPDLVRSVPRANDDVDVPVEQGDEPNEPLRGKPIQLEVPEVRHVRLRNSKSLRDCRLAKQMAMAGAGGEVERDKDPDPSGRFLKITGGVTLTPCRGRRGPSSPPTK